MRKKIVLAMTLMAVLMGMFGAVLKVQRVEAPYPIIFIRADGSIDPPTANITTLDNITYTLTTDINASIIVEKNSTIVDGAGYTLQGSGSGTGIRISVFAWEQNVTIKNIEIASFSIGISLTNTGNTTVSANKIRNCSSGIAFGESWNNIISGNNITDNTNGIGGSTVMDTIISENIITDNTNGILFSWAQNNTIYFNNIIDNEYGIYMVGGSVYNNAFYHNNLINNTNQVYIEQINPNVWDDDYPSGGNYWSNYAGVDLNHDGIGDTPHVIDANNTDYYPLMGMFSDFEATLEYNVQVICNSTVSDFQFEYFTPSEIRVISFDVMGEDGTNGFCRICIPTALMDEPYTVLVNATEVSYNLLPFSNETHSYLYFTYGHSTQEVIIIPEFSTWTSILLILIVLTVAIAFYKRRRLKPPIH